MSVDPDRADGSSDRGLQHERTALAWERTAVATIVAGVLLARYTAMSLPAGLAVIGIGQVVVGACMLVWTGRHYEDLHGLLRTDESPVHPTAARVVGVTTLAFTGAATALAVVIAVT